MSYKLVNATQLDEDLTSIADIIRAKTKGEVDLVFPTDFNSEIENNLITASQFINRTGLKGEAVVDILFSSQYDHNSACAYCTLITSIIFTNTLTVPAGICQSCTNLLNVYADKATLLGNNAFNSCNKLTVLAFPRVNSCNTNTFQNCTNLTIVDWGGQGSSSSISGGTFNGCSQLSTLILRNATTITTLANINVFTNTPFASGKAGGILYVPNDLITTYQESTNWATILGYGNGEQNQILAIETSPYKDYYGDGRLITNVNN